MKEWRENGRVVLRWMVAALWAGVFGMDVFGAGTDGRISVLILSGQNNHAWRETTPMLRSMLESTGRFAVEQCLAARAIAAKHGRIFQYGTQNRSVAQVRLGIQLALNGGIGKVKTINVWGPPGEKGFSATPELVPPKSLNYELWQGPAPMRPFCHDRFFVGYGGGGFGNAVLGPSAGSGS